MNRKSYTPWSLEDDNNLRSLVKAGKKANELAKLFQRSEGAIQSRMKRLGISGSSSSSSPSFPNKNTSKTTNMAHTKKNLYVDPKHGRIRLHFKTGLEISEDGEVVSKTYSDSHTGDTKSFSPVIHQETDGREYVMWSDKKVYIDEMVCSCFHGSPKSGQSVVHKDGNITNSAASNLKWS